MAEYQPLEEYDIKLYYSIVIIIFDAMYSASLYLSIGLISDNTSHDI